MPLDAVPSTLLIPLAARAFGARLYPGLCVGDTIARRAMEALGDDGEGWLADHASVYGVLARTAVFRDLALALFARWPKAVGVNLGAGLGHYFQWLDNGENRWIDADLSQVVALRERLIPDDGPRRRTVVLDATERGWWQALALPTGTPVLVLCEGVLMYFDEAQVAGFLAEVAEHAAPGSMLAFDALSSLAIGQARHHPSVGRTAAEFRWGLRRVDDITRAQPRLQLKAEHAVMEGYGWPFMWAETTLRWCWGAPSYAVMAFEVGPWPAHALRPD